MTTSFEPSELRKQATISELWREAVNRSKLHEIPVFEVYRFLLNSYASELAWSDEVAMPWYRECFDYILDNQRYRRISTCKNDFKDQGYQSSRRFNAVVCHHCGWKVGLISLEMVKLIRPRIPQRIAQPESSYRTDHLRDCQDMEYFGFFIHTFHDAFPKILRAMPEYELEYYNELRDSLFPKDLDISLQWGPLSRALEPCEEEPDSTESEEELIKRILCQIPPSEFIVERGQHLSGSS